MHEPSYLLSQVLGAAGMVAVLSIYRPGSCSQMRKRAIIAAALMAAHWYAMGAIVVAAYSAVFVIRMTLPRHWAYTTASIAVLVLAFATLGQNSTSAQLAIVAQSIGVIAYQMNAAGRLRGALLVADSLWLTVACIEGSFSAIVLSAAVIVLNVRELLRGQFGSRLHSDLKMIDVRPGARGTVLRR